MKENGQGGASVTEQDTFAPLTFDLDGLMKPGTSIHLTQSYGGPLTYETLLIEPKGQLVVSDQVTHQYLAFINVMLIAIFALMLLRMFRK